MRLYLEDKESEQKIIDSVEGEFGVEDLPFKGITYIMPDGKFLDLRNCTHHSDVEKYLIDLGLSEYEFRLTQGSQTMYDIGAIRCDTTKWYMVLTERQPTDEQYKALLVWLDMLGSRQAFVEVYTFDGQVQKYRFAECISDEVVDKIRRFYIFGKLYEHNLK